MSVFKLETNRWHIVRVVFLLASVLTFASVCLTVYTGSLWWLALAGFVAIMQFIFAITGYCPSAIILDKLGVPRK